MADFFLTLVSSSSTEMFPRNTTSSFTVLLPEKISLNGSWRVALAEIHYNYNFFNVTDENNRIILVEKSNDLDSNTIQSTDKIISHEIKLTNGCYLSVEKLIASINDSLKDFVKRNGYIFSINKANNRTNVHREYLKDHIECVFLEGRLAMQLGFKPMSNILETEISMHVGNIYFGIPDQMLIYTDIIEPSFIGHEKTYVLKIVNTEATRTSFGDSCYKEYTHMHYMPVQRREFDAISVAIRDCAGKFMPFQHGVLTLKLHFKKQNA